MLYDDLFLEEVIDQSYDDDLFLEEVIDQSYDDDVLLELDQKWKDRAKKAAIGAAVVGGTALAIKNRGAIANAAKTAVNSRVGRAAINVGKKIGSAAKNIYNGGRRATEELGKTGENLGKAADAVNKSIKAANAGVDLAQNVGRLVNDDESPQNNSCFYYGGEDVDYDPICEEDVEVYYQMPGELDTDVAPNVFHDEVEDTYDDMSYEEKPEEIYDPRNVEIIKYNDNYYMDHSDLCNYMYHCAKPTYESAIEDIIEAYSVPELCLESVIVLIDEETIADMDDREKAIIGDSYVRFELKNQNDLFNASLDDSDDIFEYRYQNDDSDDIDDDILDESYEYQNDNDVIYEEEIEYNHNTYNAVLLEALSEKWKKRLKIGAAVAGATALAYGAHKYNQNRNNDNNNNGSKPQPKSTTQQTGAKQKYKESEEFIKLRKRYHDLRNEYYDIVEELRKRQNPHPIPGATEDPRISSLEERLEDIKSEQEKIKSQCKYPELLDTPSR